MRRALILTCATALGAVLFSPAPASAAVTCSFTNATDVLLVNINAGGSLEASVDRTAAGTIEVSETGPSGAPLACTNGPVTVNDVDTIDVNDVTGTNTALIISLQGGALAPGEDAAEANGPEIEFTYNAGGTGTDRLEVEGSDAADDLDLGQVGAASDSVLVNLNPAADGAVRDCNDVLTGGVENVVVRGRGGDDDVNATSCNGISGGAPLDPASLRIEGNNQADSLRGGPGVDSVAGGTQDDNVRGGDGDDIVTGDDQDDKLDGGVGADVLEGGDGTDRALYDDRATPLTITVGNGGAEDGGAEDQGGSGRDNVGASTEHVTGGSAGDSITGSSVRNVLNGGLGDDFLLGGDGNDDVEGEGGNDTVDGEGGNDESRGGDGTDTARGGSGSDDVFGGAAADKLLGGAGGDVLKGDKGKDKFSGQGGLDKLNAKDGQKDSKISCGKGKAAKEGAKVDKVDPEAKSC